MFELPEEHKKQQRAVLKKALIFVALTAFLFPCAASAYGFSSFKKDSPLLAENTVKKYGQMINIASLLQDLDSKLILSVIVVESEGKSFAKSNRGAQGLMQLMPGTAREMGAKDPQEPFQNILAGTKYLKILQSTYGFDVKESLVAYNMGPDRAKRWLSQYEPEDSLYVQKVMHVYNMLAEKNKKEQLANSSPTVATGVLTKPARLVTLNTPPISVDNRRIEIIEGE